jgi:Na+-translocating ferredoxin:NAD+ oxidoreductase RNF subunit RnfB
LLFFLLFPCVRALQGDIRIDLDEECAEWASAGKCARGEHTLKTCPKSCVSFVDDTVEKETEKDSKDEIEKGPEEEIARSILEDEQEETE